MSSKEKVETKIETKDGGLRWELFVTTIIFLSVFRERTKQYMSGEEANIAGLYLILKYDIFKMGYMEKLLLQIVLYILYEFNQWKRKIEGKPRYKLIEYIDGRCEYLIKKD